LLLFSNPLVGKSRSDGSSGGKGRDVFGLFLVMKKGQNKVTKIHSKEETLETAIRVFLGRNPGISRIFTLWLCWKLKEFRKPEEKKCKKKLEETRAHTVTAKM
jgi:hypothetical protein